MTYPFQRLSERLQLLYCLIANGFDVRMHAYEYILIHNSRLSAIVILEPSKEKASILLLPSYEGDIVPLLRKITNCIHSIRKDIEIVLEERRSL
ncbi:MAG: hypothetical protein DRJ51_08390 [Thermoprotei archaeon]|nr:MAG: hypothetical protein DRJ51_08390 [Thermoprotei archaeon]